MPPRRWTYLVLFAGVCVLYARTWEFDFVNFDDPEYVTQNPHVLAGLTWDSIAWAFTAFHSGHWHPLTWLSLMANAEIHGLHAGYFHLTNVGLHALNAAVLCAVVGSMTRSAGAGVLVAALFAVHPLRVESVAWITERKDVLSGLFFLLALGSYLGYARRPVWWRYGLVVVCFALGLLSKPMLVTLPAVLLLLDFWPLGRIRGWSPPTAAPAIAAHAPGWIVVEKLPLVGLAVGSSLMTIASQRAGGALVQLGQIPLDERLANVVSGYATYVAQFLWPTGLAVFYPYTAPPWYAPALAVVLVAITAVAVHTAQRAPYLTVGWLWFVVMLLPVIGLVQVGGQSVADRFMYLPSIGLALAAVCAAGDVTNRYRWARPVLRTVAVAVVALWTVATWRQLAHWRDSVTLFQRALAVTSDNFMAHTNLGTALAARGETDEADAHYIEAVRLNPTYPVAQNNMGNVMARRGDYSGAARHFAEAVRLQPGFVAARYHLGLALYHQGRTADAEAEFRRVLQLAPHDGETHYSLGHLLHRSGRFADAVTHLQVVTQQDRGRRDAHVLLGISLAALGDLEGARQHYRDALALRADDPETLDRLGSIDARLGNLDAAVDAYRRALALRPAWPDARLHLGIALAAAGSADQGRICQPKGSSWRGPWSWVSGRGVSSRSTPR